MPVRHHKNLNYKMNIQSVVMFRCVFFVRRNFSINFHFELAAYFIYMNDIT